MRKATTWWSYSSSIFFVCFARWWCFATWCNQPFGRNHFAVIVHMGFFHTIETAWWPMCSCVLCVDQMRWLPWKQLTNQCCNPYMYVITCVCEHRYRQTGLNSDRMCAGTLTLCAYRTSLIHLLSTYFESEGLDVWVGLGSVVVPATMLIVRNFV